MLTHPKIRNKKIKKYFYMFADIVMFLFFIRYFVIVINPFSFMEERIVAGIISLVCLGYLIYRITSFFLKKKK